MDDIDRLDFTPYADRSAADLQALWLTEATKIRSWRRQIDLVNDTPAAIERWKRERLTFLAEVIADSLALMVEYEDALLWHRRPKPTDIPAGVIL